MQVLIQHLIIILHTTQRLGAYSAAFLFFEALAALASAFLRFCASLNRPLPPYFKRSTPDRRVHLVSADRRFQATSSVSPSRSTISS